MRVVLALSVVALTLACSRAPRGRDRDRNVIRGSEIATVDAATAYDIVAKLRGEFLRARGTVSRSRTGARPTQETPSVTVFIDDVEVGTVERTLHLIPASEVLEIRLYRAADAATRYGSRHNGGVVAVTTKRFERP